MCSLSSSSSSPSLSAPFVWSFIFHAILPHPWFFLMTSSSSFKLVQYESNAIHTAQQTHSCSSIFLSILVNPNENVSILIYTTFCLESCLLDRATAFKADIIHSLWFPYVTRTPLTFVRTRTTLWGIDTWCGKRHHEDTFVCEYGCFPLCSLASCVV